MNKESRPLTQEQRKEFVQLLKDAKVLILAALQDRSWKRQDKAKDVAREALLKRIGADEQAKTLREARKTIKGAEQALDKLGVYINSSNRICFSGDHEDDYDAEITEKASEAVDAETEEVRKKYEMATAVVRG